MKKNNLYKRDLFLWPVLLGIFCLLFPAAAVPSGPVKERILVIASSGEPGNLDPCMGGPPWTTEIVSAIYETPIGYRTQKLDGYSVQIVDDQKGWKPLLAESVEISENRRVITFHLKRGVSFYPSGNEMTSKDWIWSWQRQLSEPPLGWCVFENKEASITSPDYVIALDDYTVQITLDQPNPRSLPFMRFQMFAILDSEEINKHASGEDPWATEWLSLNTAGTGPYYISSLDPGSEVVLEANPYYWNGEPYFSKVVIKIIKDLSTRLALISRGDVDIASNIPAKLAESMKDNQDVRVLSIPSGNRTYIGFDTKKAPFKDIMLRKAVAYATPYKEMIKNVFFGHARLFNSFVLPEVPGYSGTGFGYQMDLDKAREFLSRSTYSGEEELVLKIDAANAEYRDIALLLQDYLGRIGLSVSIKTIPSGEFSSKLYSKKLDFFIHAGISWIDDPSTITGLWMESKAYGNFTRFSNSEVDRLQEKWQFELYGPQRNRAYQRIQEIYNREVNVIYLALADYIVLLRKDIRGYVLYKDTGIRFKDLYAAE